MIRGPSYTGGGWFHHSPTITDLMHETFRGMLIHKHPSAILNIETHFFDVTLAADSCEYTVDIGKEVWLNRSRWSRLTREYVPREGLCQFIEGAADILEGNARSGACISMLFNDPRRFAKKHRWGGCLQAATFRGDLNDRPTLTFYSRTSYLGYMGLLDAAIASVIARTICEQFTDVPLSEIGFRWHLTSAQLHHFKSLPFIYSQPDIMEMVESQARYGDEPNPPPALEHIGNWYAKVHSAWESSGHDPEKMLAIEKYGPFRRIKRRWLEHMGHLDKNIPPSLTPSQLDFTKCQ